MGRPVEAMLTPGSVSDVRGLYGLPLDLPQGSTLIGDKGYNDAVAEVLRERRASSCCRCGARICSSMSRG